VGVILRGKLARLLRKYASDKYKMMSPNEQEQTPLRVLYRRLKKTVVRER